VLLCADLSEAARSSIADATPSAGSQMIQLKSTANAADSHTDAPWSMTYQDQPVSCIENTGNVLTWNAGGETAEDCMRACASWGEETVNQNSNRTCSAGFLYQNMDGTKFCRLFEKCDACRAQEFPGTTFQLGEPCKPQCLRSDCKKDQGFKPKPGFRDIPCASDCTPDECCDMIPGWTTTATTAAPATCERNRWCTDGDMTFSYEDCNEDGVLDMVCNRANGQRWIALSGDCLNPNYNNGKSIPCSDIPKGAPSTCVRGSWCTGADFKFRYEDCNEDGVLDMVCNRNNGQIWIALSGDCMNPNYNSGKSIPCSDVPKVR